MSSKDADFDNKIYTGILEYAGDDYQFVFSSGKLKLIPASKEKRAEMWKFGKKEIAKGVYTSDEPPRMEEDILVGRCHESNEQIYNAIYILPFLVYRLYLWKKAKKAPANYSTRMLGEANKHLAPSYSLHSPELPWIRSRKEARCLADSG